MSAKNELKIRVLAALESGNWLGAGMISALSGLRPKRGVYGYMRRLQRWRLVRRRQRIGQRVTFAITERGRARLAWLREQQGSYAPEARLS
jgi:DNA-binding PadR family transcriptional regulator